MMKKPTRLLFVITGLSAGGAENMLCRLAIMHQQAGWEVMVISMTDGGWLVERMQAVGVKVLCLHLACRRPLPLVKSLFRLVTVAKKIFNFHANFLQGWMYHANFFSLFIRLLCPRAAVFWSVRAANVDLATEKITTAWMIRANSRLARWVRGTIFNSSNSEMLHREILNFQGVTTVIPNGFDVELFTPCHEKRLQIRQQLNASADTFLIGMVGRVDPVKNHVGFLTAFAQIAARFPQAQAVLVGRKAVVDNQALWALVVELNLQGRVHLCGEQTKMADWYPAFDLLVNCSFSEAFPNVIGEAMACEVPCVVTDVGDSAWVVGDTGVVVPVGDTTALQTGMEKLLALSAAARVQLGQHARQRIVENFSLVHIAQQYRTWYAVN